MVICVLRDVSREEDYYERKVNCFLTEKSAIVNLIGDYDTSQAQW